MNVCRNLSASLLCLSGVLLASGAVAAADPPLRRERPDNAPNEQSSAQKSDTAPSPCQVRLRELASFKPAPPITGPGGTFSLGSDAGAAEEGITTAFVGVALVDDGAPPADLDWSD